MKYQMHLELENKEIIRRYEDMISHCYINLSINDLIFIKKAFNLAKEGHKNQRRNTGEPYIYHPIAVAKIICQEIGLDYISIAAALLHDIVEDTKITLEEIELIFGKKMSKIISGLTKISTIDSKEINIQNENFKKILITLSYDIRVILIKIADRLHNMRTLYGIKTEKQKKIALETIDIYAPLAHRMGLYSIKSELEDLSLKYNDPQSYYFVEKKLLESKESREIYITNFSKLIKNYLDYEKIDHTLKSRTKSINSIIRKIKKQNISFEEIFDIFAIRIIYKSDQKNEKFLAWKIYSIITDKFRSNPNRIRDWISQPRSTGYESLHATIIGFEGKWIEIQIRSERMDEIAEKGIAAHYKYKEGFIEEDNHIKLWINQVRELLESQNTQTTQELLDNFKLNLYSSEIFIFSIKGDLKILPNGSSILDYAYSIHTLIGDSCLGAKVNGKIVILSYILKSGDQVEIITNKNQKPRSEWLDFVITSRAKYKIKSALNTQKIKLCNEGKKLLIEKLKYFKIEYNEFQIRKLLIFFKLKTLKDLFYEIGIGNINNQKFKEYIKSKSLFLNFLQKFKIGIKKREIKEKNINKKLDLLFFGFEGKKIKYTFSTCCSPIPGDNIVGFLLNNKEIKIHKSECLYSYNIPISYEDRKVIKYKLLNSDINYRVEILISGIDIIGIINKITNIIFNEKINILSINSFSDNGLFQSRWIFSIQNKLELDNLIKKIKSIQGIQTISKLS